MHMFRSRNNRKHERKEHTHTYFPLPSNWVMRKYYKSIINEKQSQEKGESHKTCFHKTVTPKLCYLRTINFLIGLWLLQ